MLPTVLLFWITHFVRPVPGRDDAAYWNFERKSQLTAILHIGLTWRYRLQNMAATWRFFDARHHVGERTLCS